MSDEPLNGNLDESVSADTCELPWSSSPSGTVWRKRLHRVGPAESGQVTSIVRYEPGAQFPPHDHPDGEEILVLDGVFSDEHGDWPAGTYLLNPEGFRHAPFSQPGCEIFVKLRQYPGTDREHIALNTHEIPWQAGELPGQHVKPLYSQSPFTDRVQLVRLDPGASYAPLGGGGVEIYLLSGSFNASGNRFEAGMWLRVPDTVSLHLHSARGCTLYCKTGGFTYMASTTH